MNVKVVVLKNGVSLLGEVLYSDMPEHGEDLLRIKNPVEVLPGSIKDDAASVSFFPYLHYVVEAYEKGIPFMYEDILCVLTPNETLIDHYTSAFNKDLDESQMETIDPWLQCR